MDHTFAGKRRFDDAGNEIEYTINEEAVTWYLTKVSGYVITNTYQPETTSASVIKIWNDNDNVQKIRPKAIAVILLPTKEWNIDIFIVMAIGNISPVHKWRAYFDFYKWIGQADVFIYAYNAVSKNELCD